MIQLQFLDLLPTAPELSGIGAENCRKILVIYLKTKEFPNMKISPFFMACAFLSSFHTASWAEPDVPTLSKTKASPNAKVSILEPANGAVLTSPFTVKFGVEGMTLAPAGTPKPMSGHHHLLVNVSTLPDLALPIPANAQHIHFGKAQTGTTLNLAPGKHTLQLLLGDYLHRPHDKPVLSDKISVTVVEKVKK